MKKYSLQEKYPVWSVSFFKKEISYPDISSIIHFFQKKIEADSDASFIALFDHMKHTQALSDGEISPEIKDAKVLVFCFGKKLDNPLQLAVRPRSIGIAETEDSFVISFLEAPNPASHQVMLGWVESF